MIYFTQKADSDKDNQTYALKIFHNESQIKQGLREEIKERGMSAVKKEFDKVYSREAKTLEIVQTLKSEYIVRPLFRLLVVLVEVHDVLCP